MVVFGAEVFADAVLELGVVLGEGFGVAATTEVFALVSVAGEGVIDPLVQICERSSLLISNSMTLRFGSRGVAGGVIVFPLIAS